MNGSGRGNTRGPVLVLVVSFRSTWLGPRLLRLLYDGCARAHAILQTRLRAEELL